MITDTHCHLDVVKDKLDAYLKNAKEKGVHRIIIPAIESDNMKNILDIVEKHENIFFSVGNHPNRLNHFSLKEIENLIQHEKCVAVGECGLDWYRIPNGANIEDVKKHQKDIFSQQIELSIAYKKPLILHSRDTDDDMVEMLEKYGDKLIGGVVHCYVGSDKLLSLQKYGFYYGIGGVSTYSSAKDLHRNLKRLSIDKIVLETDTPYLTPEPFRKEKNQPAYTRLVLEEIVKLKGGNLTFIENQIEKNVNKLFF